MISFKSFLFYLKQIKWKYKIAQLKSQQLRQFPVALNVKHRLIYIRLQFIQTQSSLLNSTFLIHLGIASESSIRKRH